MMKKADSRKMVRTGATEMLEDVHDAL